MFLSSPSLYIEADLLYICKIICTYVSCQASVLEEPGASPLQALHILKLFQALHTGTRDIMLIFNLPINLANLDTNH